MALVLPVFADLTCFHRTISCICQLSSLYIRGTVPFCLQWQGRVLECSTIWNHQTRDTRFTEVLSGLKTSAVLPRTVYQRPQAPPQRSLRRRDSRDNSRSKTSMDSLLHDLSLQQPKYIMGAVRLIRTFRSMFVPPSGLFCWEIITNNELL